MRTFVLSKSVMAAALIAAAAGAIAFQAGLGGQTVAAQGMDRVQGDNACYVRLPDLPGKRYGGFGGYNPDTGVLAYAGGAEKRTEENTIAYYDLFAIKLDGTMQSWNKVTYSAASGYTRETDRGCREMASVQTAPDRWISVGGKDGCAGGGSTNGDIKELQIGATANTQGVKWTSNSGVDLASLPQELQDGKMKLLRLFAAYDSKRDRIVFGQGTFDDEKDTETQDEIYEAVQRGSRFNVRELKPSGPIPSRRFSSCAAYVNDPDQGLDGLIVLGGQEGGPAGSATTSYKEVWWLDFSKSASGEWSNISARFGNLDDFGYRRGGACAYDPAAKQFYSWMGRADAGVPDGAKRSSGIWRTNLSTLGDANATLSWERLAKDKMDQPMGRRLIPSVFDLKNHRFFAIGGRNDLDEYSDVWAIYPDVTGADCQNLDPYAPFAPQPSATPLPTQTPDPNKPTSEVPTQAPPPTDPPIDPANLCEIAKNKVPAAVIAAAQANPQSVAGYGLRCNPNLAGSPLNPPRTWLSLRTPSLPFHPLFNGLTWKCGCP
ncbi:MAG: hypothetical protein H6648_10320 [Caldilineae bacterium]|nr:hypothetical protein [Caldilineae bacterium]